MPPFDLLHQLHRLDPSSPDFPTLIADIVHGDGYRDCVASLQDGELAWLIEYLDNALKFIPSSGPEFRACLQELREMCGCRKTVPRSCMLPGSLPLTAKWPIASRGSCDVYEGFLGDSKVCVKKLRIYSNDKEEKAKREAALWKRLEHPNVVPLIGTTIIPFQLISVWMVGGELLGYIIAHPCADRHSLISDVADGLSYLHSHNVIHGDLKGPSIFVDDVGRARLTDFGLAAIVQDFRSAESITDGHAVRWAAPEILDKKRPVDRKSDVYSFAMVVIEVFAEKAPFYGIPPTTVAVGILAGKRPTRPTHQDLTNDLWEMTKRCWNQDPQHRPDISEVVLCLQTILAHRSDPAYVNDDRVSDDVTTLGSVRQWNSSIGYRQSRWTLFSRALQQLRNFRLAPRSTSDTESREEAGSDGCEKPINGGRHLSGSSNPPRREGFPSSRYGVSRRQSTAHQRSEMKAAPTHDNVPPASDQAVGHSVSFKHTFIKWTKHRMSHRAYPRGA